ncbi:hypothetical protein OGH69_17360 [Flavobacterium sp. MFBS3-15]|uniref:hypothetical protein n=1 Tax=Flavobacterium sp. MFBS3-15 TaxID=2989816 RepID=UPI0022357CE7|nr:hypothetical protein [Flavobacterium sp. MFBS3-15]MCW4470744.1 hypothetical protein [Flavobacterium sp. MFBS3-15]
MFKNIQHTLLLRYPLLWNTRIVPLAAIGILLNIIFFVWGYNHGAVDFGPFNTSYYIDATPAIVIMLSIVLALLTLILWLVFYLRNNAFKSFYPQRGSALYKEWLIILLACMINCSYSLSFLYGQDVRGRGYFPEEEFSHRIDVISMASLFADGGFEDDGVDQTWVNDKPVYKHRNYTTFRGKKYPLKSLLNKETSSFTYQRGNRDSITEDRVKGWLMENRKDSVLWLMKEFDKIVKSHAAKTNVTPEKWLELTYDYPAFAKYITVGRVEFYEMHEEMRAADSEGYVYEETAVEPAYVDSVTTYEDDYTKQIDTVSNSIKIIDSVTYIYPKYVVPLRQLEHAYADISESYTNPEVDGGILIAYFVTASGFSLLIFSFRVTSGRAWLIALVAFGLSALVTSYLNFGLLDDIMRIYYYEFREEISFFIMWLAILLVLFLYFYRKKNGKGNSDIILNLLLWLSPAILPVLIFLSGEIVAQFTWKRYAAKEDDYWGAKEKYQSAYEAFLDDNPALIAMFCIAAFIIFMYFFTNAIKKWKGVAES